MKKPQPFLYKLCRALVAVIFMATSLYAHQTQAGDLVVPVLPAPGVPVALSASFNPSILQGIVIQPDNALKFDFLIQKGNSKLDLTQKQVEYNKLIKYFLASLTIADKDQWVNLSPYEKGRIIENSFGKTDMGRDLLAQDYLLKQMTSSLMNPESTLGKSFWDRVYQEVYKEYGDAKIPVNTFNKVWITPEHATVVESGKGTAESPLTAIVLNSHLKVMLEEDYLSLQHHSSSVNEKKTDNKAHAVASKIVRDIILPQLEKEVNEGQNFANLRQIVSGMILATWYKKTLKESLLGQVYADQSKVKGVEQSNPQANQIIYQKYITAFKKGVYNFIKEDIDPMTKTMVPRKYFAGGFVNQAMVTIVKASNLTEVQKDMAMAVVANAEVDRVNVMLYAAGEYRIIAEKIYRFAGAEWVDVNQIGNELNYKRSDEIKLFEDTGGYKLLVNLKDAEGGNVTKIIELGEGVTQENALELLQYALNKRTAQISTQRIMKSKNAVTKELNAIVANVTDELHRQKNGNIDPWPDHFTDEFIMHPNSYADFNEVHEYIMNHPVLKRLFNELFVLLAERKDGELGKKGRDKIKEIKRLIDMRDDKIFNPEIRKGYNLYLETINIEKIDADMIKKDEPAFYRFIDYSVNMEFKSGQNRLTLLANPDPYDDGFELELSRGSATEAVRIIDRHIALTVYNDVKKFLSKGQGDSIDLNELIKKASGKDAAMSSISWNAPSWDPIINDIEQYSKRVNGTGVLLYQREFEDMASEISKDDELNQWLDLYYQFYRNEKDTNILPIQIPVIFNNIKQRMIAMGSSILDHGGYFRLGKIIHEQNNLDPAMAVSKPDNTGGIDLNAANLDLRIKRNGAGVPLPVAQQDLAQLGTIEGFVPAILDIKPVTALPILSELQ